MWFDPRHSARSVVRARRGSGHGGRLPRHRSLGCEPLEPRALLAAAFADFDDPNPSPGNWFGATVLPLSTGNVVITSPYDDYGATDAGAVYLFNGATGALISTFRGSHPNDHVGIGGVTALANANYVVSSPEWDNGEVANAGAATWGNGTTGIKGIVNAANSLIGSGAFDQVSNSGVTALKGGNYVVSSSLWSNGVVTAAGAATWGNGTTGIKGTVSAANSLVGSWSYDQVGGSVTALTGGNYVVGSRFWGSGAAEDRGAATWGDGATGIKGIISTKNSLVGSTTNDHVGDRVTVLANGNYVVSSASWHNGGALFAGAATWGNGTTGIKGIVSATNSLVGDTAYDFVSEGGVTALTNGNYVVCSPYWDNDAVADVGAATWGSGTTGVKGIVSATNSLLGGNSEDFVGISLAIALVNGNYVVSSPEWDNYGVAADVGAATWANGATGLVGVVSTANSLVGNAADDHVGSYGVTPLTNGNYVVRSPDWDNGEFAANAGAATWGSGTTGLVSVVSDANSLVGSTAGDQVSRSGVTALTNGNYVVSSSSWDNYGVTADAGAATWANGATGLVGLVSDANSLIGSTASDFVGLYGATALTNGNYVVHSGYWDNGGAINAGAATWGNGTTGIKGIVSAANSLVGSKSGDEVGESLGVTALAGGNYVVASRAWDSGAAVDAGAATWGSGTTGVSGIINSQNSALGATANANLQKVIVDNVNGTFFARFLGEGGGSVRVGSQFNGFLPAPLISSFGGNLSYTENAAAILISSTATVSDVDSTNFQNGRLRVSFSAGGTSSDRLAIRTVGTGAGQINVQGSQVRYGTLVIGTFTGGSGTTPLVVTLTSQATPFRVQTLLRNITFRNVSDNPSTAPRTVRVTVSDGRSGISNPVFKKISVVAVNDKPVLSLSGTIGYVHDKPAITLAPFASVSDVDSPNFSGGRLRVRITDGASSSNRLAIGSGFTIDADNNVLRNGIVIGKRVSNGFGTSELIVTFNTKATPFVVQQLVRAITFKTVGGSAGQRKVVFTVSDGDGGVSAEAVKTVNVS